MKRNRIFLTGFMGAGKSTIGLILANTLGWEFYDLDRLIESRTGMQVKEFFKLYGEEKFREAEREALQSIVEQQEIVVALGGGTLMNRESFDLLRRNGLLVYLKSSPDQIYLRLRHKMDRPLFQTEDHQPMTKEQALEKIRTMLDMREPVYMQAEVVFQSDKNIVGKSVDQLIRIIRKQL